MALNLKFGVSTWLWTSPFTTRSVETLFPKIAGMGYDVVEIAVEDPGLIDLKVVKEGLNKYGLEAVVCGAFGPSRDFTASDPQLHHNAFAYIEQCLDMCTGLNARFFGGPMYSAVGKARMVPAEQRRKEWEMAVQHLRTVCKMAEDRGLVIGLEPLNRFESDLVNTVEDVLKLIDDINHPSAQVMLDGFHMNIEEPSIEDALVAAGDKLVHLQVSENYRGTPGTGQTRWDDYRRGLERIQYNGTLSIESFTTDNRELAGAVCFWRPMADSQDAFAINGLSFLKEWAGQPQSIPQQQLLLNT